MALSFAESSLDFLWKIVLIVFGFYFVVAERHAAAAIRAVKRRLQARNKSDQADQTDRTDQTDQTDQDEEGS